ncbi:poly [ADP-ribose] polymerase 14-like [Paramuricea clavata]|uniref:Poly [ADP-ribose] polymerase 14-like n=1 Tax=Paramuricea clavata TaxID=317549 RepID=A0A7D9L174_PARCT|nr:poly [ADP-ribose] polymerase 14-like [Paramuricea clavata]
MNYGTPETAAGIKEKGANAIIQSIERKHQCAIMVTTKEEETDRRSSFRTLPAILVHNLNENRKRTMQCRYTYPSGKIIEIHQGDILNHPVDYLVNSANDEMKHSGGLARAIVKQGGRKIQEDSSRALHDQGRNKLLPGEVITTDGGSLMCKKVLHVVVPKYSPTAYGHHRDETRNCCTNVLRNATDGQIIAVPALGTGIYNVPHGISAKSLVTAAYEFLQENPSNALREVHFVDNNPAAIEALMKEMTTRFRHDPNFQINELVPPVLSSGDMAFETPEGMEIRLTVENIAKSTADVIVRCHADYEEKKLCQLVQNLLAKVQTRSLTSIAIPALSTGTLNFPKELVAKVLFVEAMKFSSKKSPSLKIKKYNVVVYSDNTKTVDIFKQQFQIYSKMKMKNDTNIHKTKSRNFGLLKSAAKEKAKSSEDKTHGVNVEIVQGNIVQESTDASVAEDITQGGQIGAALLKAAGESLVQEYSKLDKIEAGTIVTTRAGNLKARCLLHMVIKVPTGKTEKSIIQDAVTKCLEHADLCEFTSLSLPLPAVGTRRTRQQITLEIAAKSLNDITKIKNELMQVEAEQCHSETIEVRQKLDDRQLATILEVQDLHDVRIEYEPEIGFIRISGLAKKVSNALGEIHQIIHDWESETHHMDATVREVQWFYYETNANVVIPAKYPDSINAKIERAYKNDPSGSVVVGEKMKYEIDFKTMTKTCLDPSENEIMKVHRHPCEAFPFPPNWEFQPMDCWTDKELEVHRFTIDKQSEEYRKIHDMSKGTWRIFSSLSNTEIVEIERIQNPRLHQIYEGQKKKMSNGGNEMRLFHGTTKTSVENINTTGFNRSYCGKNAVKFGKGVYFAKHAWYSAGNTFSVPDEEGLQYMYIARVLVGEYTEGKEGLVVPPPIDENNRAVCYDSVVDNVTKPQVFVIFYDYQSYPEYLVTFTNYNNTDSGSYSVLEWPYSKEPRQYSKEPGP